MRDAVLVTIYQPAETDPNKVELLISSTDFENDPHNHCLDISNQGGWRIRNIDFVAGGGGIRCKSSVLDLQGCRFFGLPQVWQNESGSDTPWLADYIDGENATLVADGCEFWGGVAPWVSYSEEKGWNGAYGDSQRVKMAFARGTSTSHIFRNCLIDGFIHVYYHPTSTGTAKFHFCEFRQCGSAGLTTCPVPQSGDVFDYIRCRIDQSSLSGWSGSSFANLGNQHVGVCLWTNARPLFNIENWWYSGEDPVGGCGYVPNDFMESHGSFQIPERVSIYNNTFIGTNGHRETTFGAGGPKLGSGAALSVLTPGNQTSTAVHRTVNNAATVVASPHDWVPYTTVGGGGDHAHVSVFAVPAGVGLNAGQVQHDYDHLHRFGTFPPTETRNYFATVIDSGGNALQCDTIADIQTQSGGLFEANGSEGDPMFATTPVWNVDDVTFRTLSRWTLKTGSPAATGGNTALSAEGWPDVDVDGTEFTYPGYSWRGALEPDVPAIEQQVGPLCPMPSAKG